MTLCSACGATVSEKARFCSECGTNLEPLCPRCGAETPPGARFCPSCGHQLAAPPQRLEERKLVTVLFADLSGSTALGERLDPERLRDVLTKYFAAMANVIEAWGGSVEKFIGDAVMAAFGVPTVREDDAQRAMHASLEMLQRLERLNTELQDRHQVTLSIRVGVNTGEVIAPAGDRMEELIVAGDAVNVAARLQGTAEPGTVLVGERTFATARDSFAFSDPIPLKVKGRSAPVLARRLIGPLAEPERGVPGLTAHMVGRELELSVLTGLLDEVAGRGEPRMAIVYGPAGIGKSRLLWELTRHSEHRTPTPLVLRGRCLAVGDGITYWALAEILRASCEIGLDDPAETVRRKLTEGLGAILAPLRLADADLRETVSALATTAGIELPENPLRDLEPNAVAEALARAWPRFVSALAADRPCLIVVEDLHWAGDQLVEMLERILARASGQVMFVTTARPEFAHSHAAFGVGREGITSISLRPLTPEQGGLLISDLLSVADLSNELREAILERAEGNPFFLEEIIRRLIDEGVLARDGTSWRTTTANTKIVLPDTVHALHAARIDALPGPEKQVLQEAAVIGKVFWASPIRQRLPDIEFSNALLGLESRGLILARPTTTIAGEPEYLFRHALIRDVAYAGLPRARRAYAHAALAGWTEELAADRLDEFGELVANHYWLAISGEDADLAWAENADERERLRTKAYSTLMEAGTGARRRYALVRAVELHRLAGEVAGSPSERLSAEEGVADDHAAAYHGDEAVASYLAALELARAHPELATHRARLTVKATREAVMKSGSFRRQVPAATLEDWIDEGLKSGPDEWARAWLLALRAGLSDVWTWSTGDDPTLILNRISDAEAALHMASQQGRLGLEVYASEALVGLLRIAGDYEQSLEIARRQLELLHDASPSPAASLLFESALVIGLDAGEWEEAKQLAARSRDIARRLSAHELMHATGTLLAISYFTGRWSEGIEILDEHLAAFTGESNVTCSNVRMGPAIGALIYAQRGEASEATTLLELLPPVERMSDIVDGCRSLVTLALGDPNEALTQAQHLNLKPNLSGRGMAHLALLEALAALHQWDKLNDALSQGRQSVQGSAALRVGIDRLDGLRLLATGDVKSALAAFQRSRDTARQLGMIFEAARATEALADAVGPESRPNLLAQALDTYRQLGAQPSIHRITAQG